MQYQVLPDLTSEEYEQLKLDIKSNGVQVAIEYDEHGNVLDGHHRIKICQELGIKTWPSIIRHGLTEAEKFSHARRLNLNRRHLTQAQRRSLIQEQLKETPDKSDRQIAKSLGVSDKTVGAQREELERTAEIPQLEKTVGLDGKSRTTQPAKKQSSYGTSKAQAQAKAKKQVKKQEPEPVSLVLKPIDNCDIRHCSMQDLFKSGIIPDAVITDPPYPKAYLSLYTDLAKACSSVPLVAVMCGQTYLPEVFERLCEHLTYRWTIAYLTPGGQAVQQWQTKVNCFWKPVLLFGEALEWIGDVSKSSTNDNDKRFHDWGQSESGMLDLVERLTKPGQLVCDPFLGGGTTALASLALARRFVGCDIDKQSIDKARARITT